MANAPHAVVKLSRLNSPFVKLDTQNFCRNVIDHTLVSTKFNMQNFNFNANIS